MKDFLAFVVVIVFFATVVVLGISGYYERSERTVIEDYIKNAESYLENDEPVCAFSSLYSALEVSEKRTEFTEQYVPVIDNLTINAYGSFLKLLIERVSLEIDEEEDYDKAICFSDPYFHSDLTGCWECWDPPLKKLDEEFFAEQFSELTRLREKAISLSVVKGEEVLLPSVEFFLRREQRAKALQTIEKYYSWIKRAGIKPSVEAENLKTRVHKLVAEEYYNSMVTAFSNSKIRRAKSACQGYLRHMKAAGEILPQYAQDLVAALSLL